MEYVLRLSGNSKDSEIFIFSEDELFEKECKLWRSSEYEERQMLYF